MASYTKSFDFDMGSLGRSLAEFDHDAERYIQRAKKEAAIRGEAAMKSEAPWRDRTTAARRGLWAEPFGDARNGGIEMGHTAEYGVYLEESNGGRFQIIMPVLVRVGTAFMQSMEAMFGLMDSPAAAPPVVLPGSTGKRGTSQSIGTRARHAVTGAKIAIEHVGKRTILRGAKGRFVSRKAVVFEDTTKTTKKTRRR
jgi:hypothetical protein